MEAKLAKNIFFSVICSLLLLGSVLGVVFGIIQRPDTTAFNSSYTESANAVVVSEIWNGSTFDSTNTQTLLNMLCNSSSGSISTLSSNIGSGTINATTLRGYSSGGNTAGKSIVVTLGGFKWIVTYLFKDSSGNTCATLWMADANGTGTFGDNSSYYGTNDWVNGYPTDMYGLSYVSTVTLNNGGQYLKITSNSSNPTSISGSATSSSTHQYAAFTHSSGGIRPYIVQPNKVPYQTSSQGTNNGQGFVLMNESLATNLTGYYSSYNYQTKTGYTNWGDDYLWLPSMSETGNTGTGAGIWQTSQAERANSNTSSWSRSGSRNISRNVYSLNKSGDSYYSNLVYEDNAIRPALHLNLTKVAKEMTKVSITLDKQSGVGGDSSVYAYPGYAMTSVSIPTRFGYTFGGYYSSANGGGTQYYTATGASATTYPSGGPTTLYAKWIPHSYTITYNANGGTISSNTATVGYEQPFTLPSPEKAGYSAEWIGESIPTGTAISTPQQLANIANDLTGSYYLTNDIDMSGWGEWDPIAEYDWTISSSTTSFKGVLDGRGYAIKNLTTTISGSDHLALFASAYGATIKNLIMENVNFSITNGGRGVAALVATAENTTITNCKVSGELYSLSESSYEGYAAAFCAESRGCTFSYLTNNANVNSDGNGIYPYIKAAGICSLGSSRDIINSCVNNGTIQGYAPEGGGMSSADVFGIADTAGLIVNCYNLGNIVGTGCAVVNGISSGTLTNCFNAGKMSFETGSGVELGSTNITNCYYLSSNNTNVTAQGTAVSSVATLASNFYNNLSDSEKAKWNYTAGSYPTLSHTVWSFEGAAGEVITFLGDSDYTATAQYTVNTYTLALNGNGASNTVANQSVTFGAGKTITNSFTRAGYTFSGWATSSTGAVAYSNGVNFDTLPVGANNNGATITLYAVWNANTYYVKYNGNGATSGSMNNSTHKYNTASNLTNNGYSRTGYTFAGWATSSTGAVAYSNGASVSTLTATNGATVELFAKWNANTYTVIYNANGGSGNMANSTHTYDVAKNLTTNSYTRSGYKFLGWSTSNSATTATYADGESVTNLTTSGNFTLYAVWRLNIYLTVSSNMAEAGSVLGGGYYEAGAQVSLVAVVNPDYGFAYWTKTDANGKELQRFVVNPLQITTSETPEYYTAVFKKNVVEGVAVTATLGGMVRLLGDDYENLADSDTVILVADVALEGYKFDGWYIEGEEQVLSTEQSVKILLSDIRDKLIIARFSPTSNTSVNQDTSN